MGSKWICLPSCRVSLLAAFIVSTTLACSSKEEEDEDPSFLEVSIFNKTLRVDPKENFAQEESLSHDCDRNIHNYWVLKENVACIETEQDETDAGAVTFVSEDGQVDMTAVPVENDELTEQWQINGTTYYCSAYNGDLYDSDGKSIIEVDHGAGLVVLSTDDAKNFESLDTSTAFAVSLDRQNDCTFVFEN